MTEPSLWPAHSYGTVYHQQFMKQTACIRLSTSSKLFCLLYVLMIDYPFLADRTNGRAIATLLRLSVVCLSSVTLCIVAKRCVLEQKLLLRAYRKSYMRNRLVPK